MDEGLEEGGVVEGGLEEEGLDGGGPHKYTVIKTIKIKPKWDKTGVF